MSSPQISIVTPTRGLPERIDFLQSAWQSLLCQSPGVEFEWLVQVDGDQQDYLRVKAALPPEASISVSINPRRLGPGASRNLALLRASAPIVASLDDDDLLPETALSTWVEGLHQNPEAHWLCAASEAFYSDGKTQLSKPLLPAGPCHAGAVFDAWLDPADPLPCWPAGMAVRLPSLTSVGGWQCLPQGEELGMLIAVTGRFPGWVSHRTVYRYRQHGQSFCYSDLFELCESDTRQMLFRSGQAIADLSAL